jgi:uncharacterized protein YbcV (DUF1398 family)
MAEGVEYYHIDYVALGMRFYGADGGIAEVPLALGAITPIASELDAPSLKAAILDSQKNGQKFKDFSRRAAEAGVIGYFAFLRGQQVTYFGRKGDHHVEWFPGARPIQA